MHREKYPHPFDTSCRLLRATPVLPQMRENAEFGEGERDIGMNIFINLQVDIVLPPFSSRRSLRGANGGS